MKLGKIFICINILVFSLLMLTGCTEKWPRIIYQNTSYRFDEYNRTIVLDGGHSYDIIETENGYDIIKEQYYKEIDNSITNTTIHACESIEAFKPTYYTWNNKHLNRGIYLNRALYSKDILFEREKQKVYPTRELRNMFAALETKSCVKLCWIELILC